MMNLLGKLSEIELKHYLEVVIPNIEKKLPSASDDEIVEMYQLYLDVLKLVAVDDFATFNKYLEIDEDKSDPNKSFYHHRRFAIKDIVSALNDIEICDKYDTLLISTPPRVGKMQRLSEPILTPNGWVKMGEIKVGDKVIGYDGKSTNVTGVFPQGIMQTYSVTFDDGTSVNAGGEHLWTVQTRDDRKNNKERTITTLDMMKNLYVENGKRKNYSISYVKPVEFENKLNDSDISPYVLGALLGDGSIINNIGFTSKDDEIVKKIKTLLPEFDEIKQTGKKEIDFRITKKDVSLKNEFGYSVKSKTQSKLEEYELFGCDSKTKFIPHNYLYSSVENRLELLRGLMDTDGYCNPNKSSYCEYTTVSEKLCNDFVELVRSLGARATISTKIGSYTDENGNKIECSKVYRITFNMELNPFYLTRKRNIFVSRSTRKVKYITKIEKSTTEECQCIMVDSPKHLYVTTGYNLTHNTTIGIRFLSWIIGRYPEETQLATSYSEAITRSFYIGALEIVNSQRYKEIFPDSPLVNQNAKSLELWMKINKRYPSISFIPINGSMTGKSEASKYLYLDDIVSNIEEAMSPIRLEKLWQTYSVNAKQRKKKGAKEIMIMTRWSIHDPITRVEQLNENNPRCLSIKLPCFDENGESNFDFFGGFDTAYYKEQQNAMDEISFNALYMQNPIEREGLLYHKEDLEYYFELPDEPPDTIISVCDSKNMGKDFVSCPVGYVYGDKIYIEDVVFDNGLPEITRPRVANILLEHKVVRCDIEANNGGLYYAEDVDDLVKKGGGKTSIRTFTSSNNKFVKIITYADVAKKSFVFKHSSKYSPNSDYGRFMKQVFGFTQLGNNPHDDSVDSLAMLAQMFQDLSGNSIKFLSRKDLRI